MIDLRLGDCRDVLKTLADASVDSCVTDPPYELGFMGKAWDGSGIANDVGMWCEVLRVLKPGGHLLAFGGSRTYHRLACAIEDAGFEIRDQIMWLYGSGFPKSLDVGKAIDRVNGESGRLYKFTAWMRSTGASAEQLNTATATCMGSHYLTDKSQPAIPTRALFEKMRPLFSSVPSWVDELVSRIEAERAVIGQRAKLESWNYEGNNVYQTGGDEGRKVLDITAPATEAARRWQGWGTALKPAHEPIVVARKPLIGTVAENVLAFGTGAINVDGCRVEGESTLVKRPQNSLGRMNDDGWKPKEGFNGSDAGRWPANVIHDGSAEVIAGFPQTAPSPSGPVRQGGYHGSGFDVGKADGIKRDSFGVGYADTGSAARFFYTAKADATDRSEGCETPSHHPTVKPTELMRYLCRLVTQPGGIVLDPFMGSGSTGKAAVLERFDFIGIEREAEYLEIARARIAWLGVTPSVDGSIAPPAQVTATGAQLALAFA